MSEIFVSFASKDVRVAMTLCSALENRGYRCWISARDIEPGANFQSAIVRALRKAKILLLVFTANSNASEEVTKELALASQNKMIVIPLRVEDVTPNDAFAYEFATRQWIDFVTDWEASIEQLCRRIGQAVLDRSAGLTTPTAADALNDMIAAGATRARVTARATDEAQGRPEPGAPEAKTPPQDSGGRSARENPAPGGSAGPLAAPPAAIAPPESKPLRSALSPITILAGLAAAAVVVVILAVVALQAKRSKPPGPGQSAAALPAAAPIMSRKLTITTAAAPAPAVASDLTQGASDGAAAPKPVKRKKAAPKVDIPF